MYVRRDCLAQVGAFDAEHFGKGYGEENDFCMRATYRGWRHLLATDTFVRHLGGTSFGAAKDPAIERALSVLDGLHPDYGPRVGAHLQEDPAFPFRRRLDVARLGGPRPTVLYVSHDRGGGTERHVLDMATRLEEEGYRALILRPDRAGHVRLERVTLRQTPNLVFAIPEEFWTLREVLRGQGVVHVHIHHTIGLAAEVLDLIRNLGVPYDWTVHDYYPICPRINLIDEGGVYCGEPAPARCNVCLERGGSPRGREGIEIRQWRRDYAAWLAGARKVFVPHRDVCERLGRYFPDIEFVERRHLESLAALARPVGARFVPGEVLRVAVIGMIGAHKGSAVLLGAARDAAARRLPIRFHVVGFTDQDAAFRSLPNVSITGRYREEEVFDRLETVRCHCAFFPSLWPETYSYVLSIALLGKLFPVAFDLGAQAERIRACGVGHLIPLTLDPAVINRELLSLTGRLAEPITELHDEMATYATLIDDYYGLSWAKVKAA
jgi:glycosyltransferase involved in cell wall biosynthesis